MLFVDYIVGQAEHPAVCLGFVVGANDVCYSAYVGVSPILSDSRWLYSLTVAVHRLLSSFPLLKQVTKHCGCLRDSKEEVPLRAMNTRTLTHTHTRARTYISGSEIEKS